MGRRFLSLVVTPGTECKIVMPPCSALEIKHAALAAAKKPPMSRCTLECDLATHTFVLCSLPPGGPMQASLGTVVTNDPDVSAWLFLKATGPRAFHVLGRINVDEQRSSFAKVDHAHSKWPTAIGCPSHEGTSALTPIADIRDLGSKAEDDALDESDDEEEKSWPTANNIVSHQFSSRVAPCHDGATATAGSDGASDPSEIIEVLLPEGDDVLEYPLSDAPSDDASDDFVQWMANRAHARHGALPRRRARGGDKGSAYTSQQKEAGVGPSLPSSNSAVAVEVEAVPMNAGQRGGTRTLRPLSSQKRAHGCKAFRADRRPTIE